jgi:acetyl esterase/lipase
MSQHFLEPAAQDFADATAKPPFLYELGPDGDEGEAYAGRLTAAGVRTTSVRYNGILHDFMMLDPLRHTAATTGAIEQAIHVLRKALDTD